MKALQLAERDQRSNDVEYSVYVYHFYDSSRGLGNDWEKKEITDSPDHALMHAEVLFASGKYRKIEIKKKFFDFRHSCMVDTTFKTFEKSRGGLLATIGAFMRNTSDR